jgi:hypothetical protein
MYLPNLAKNLANLREANLPSFCSLRQSGHRCYSCSQGVRFSECALWTQALHTTWHSMYHVPLDEDQHTLP